ncbi:MAG: AAA family ATPase [Anaerolineaceae bacterium]|nr:AAA family ATPase [Anaerolineaceae bacterium]
MHRIASYLTGPADWLDQFQALAQLDQSSRIQNLEQFQVLEELTQVLKTFSGRHPLLIILDDLQWIDDASKNLLYHLGRRLSGSRFLLLAACRLAETNAGRSPEQAASADVHPIQSLIQELSRHYGDIQINLNRTDPAEGRRFIDALLDHEPNHLDRAFRDALFRYTQGQPLFTVELIRNLQENGSLILNDEGSWIVNKAVQALPLPARIEALISHRLDMLPASLRNLLTVASVEGELFTVEAVSAAVGMDQQIILQQLTQVLQRQYQLVQDQGEIQLGKLRLNRFQFRHVLFQEYLYDQLTTAEKRRPHRTVAENLEKILFTETKNEILGDTDRLDLFGTELVRHFWFGEVWDKAAAYALNAGKQARARYAMREAINYFELALSALDHLTDAPDERIYETILCWEEAAHKYRPYEEQLNWLSRAEAIARRQVDKPRLIQVLHWKANVFLSRGLWTQAGPALTECLALSDELGNEQLSVRPTYFKALMTSFADPASALNWIDLSLDLASKYNDQHIQALALGTKAQALAQMGEFARSQQAVQGALQLASQLGSPLTVSDVDLLAAWTYLARGEILDALEFSQRSVAEAIATDNMDCICNGLACIGYGNLELQRISEAVSAFEKGIERSKKTGAIIPMLNGQAGLATAQFYSGRREAVNDLESILASMKRYEFDVGAANANLMLGMCFLQLGLFERAETNFHDAIEYYRRTQMRPFLAKALLGLTALYEKQGRLAEAQMNRAEADLIIQKFSLAG